MRVLDERRYIGTEACITSKWLEIIFGRGGKELNSTSYSEKSGVPEHTYYAML